MCLKLNVVANVWENLDPCISFCGYPISKVWTENACSTLRECVKISPNFSCAKRPKLIVIGTSNEGQCSEYLPVSFLIALEDFFTLVSLTLVESCIVEHSTPPFTAPLR